MSKLNEYQKQEKNNKQALAELLAPFVDKAYLKEDGREENHFVVIVERAGIKYRANKDYNGKITFFVGEDWPRFKALSSYKISEIEKQYARNSVKVPSQKKITAELDAEDAIRAAILKEQAEAIKKHADFLEMIKGEPVRYDYNTDYKTNKKTGAYDKIRTDIRGGTIETGFFVFDFELGENGYISQKISLSYKLDNNFKSFKELTKHIK